MTGKSRDNYNENYLNYVKTQDPPTQHLKNCAAAFGVGGLICCIGQFIRYSFEFAGFSGDELAGLSFNGAWRLRQNRQICGRRLNSAYNRVCKQCNFARDRI